MAKTLVGIFDDLTSAQSVLQELKIIGVHQDHVRLMNNTDTQSFADADDPSFTDADDDAQSLSGTDAQSFTGADAQPLVESSRTRTRTADQTWTEKVGNWFSSLMDDDADKPHADQYAEAWRRGNYLVVADVESTEVERAVAIMNQYGSVDVNRRAEQWKSTGYTGSFDHTAAPYTADQREQELATYRTGRTENEAIPVVQEELSVGRRVVQRGGVRIHSYVEERPVEETIRLREERINVERRPVNRPVDGSDAAFQDRTIEVAASGEEAVVEKRARVVEEVVVGKEVEQRDQKIEETVRRKDVRVEQMPSSNIAPASRH